jgi:hypothetical protein
MVNKIPLILLPEFSHFFFFFFCGIGDSSQGLHLEPLHQPFFVIGFFETGSRKLFAQADFKLRSF